MEMRYQMEHLLHAVDAANACRAHFQRVLERPRAFDIIIGIGCSSFNGSAKIGYRCGCLMLMKYGPESAFCAVKFGTMFSLTAELKTNAISGYFC